MTLPDPTARYTIRWAGTAADIELLQRFRARCFGLQVPCDADAFDTRCAHVMIEETAGGRLVCCFRIHGLAVGEVAHSYSAQYYDLSALSGYGAPMLEIGRFCIDPACRDADILRLAWAGVGAEVDAGGVGMLFGCSSFAGTDASAYLDAFALLKARHLAPQRWLPRVKAPDVFRFAARRHHRPDLRKAARLMPPLLRSYLAMGGWVSDHAVVDREMNTLHVFTALEVEAIPPVRKRLLRTLAPDLPAWGVFRAA